ncbi:aspartate kinase [Streptomyces orinoci]|uniref:Aspartokinase n=1 Tax=Streptomyces orinoci TaxID=67339 RepID=A0ABV3JYY5_STRON|nr:aspartate kinase [Streptomyces orinoci]
MALIVQKYGGSSVRSTERIKQVAEQLAATRRAGHDLVVVVSAMGDTTDQLLGLAREVAPVPARRELDLLLATGECVSSTLTAMALNSLGAPARSLSGPQAGVLTTAAHGRARITGVEPRRVREGLERGEIVLVTGFQGLNRETQELTTLGRGGSDTTAVALAAALRAEVCEICTDVDGVHTADPHLVPAARPLPSLTYETMQELSDGGARVLAPRSVAYARRYRVPVHVRSSFASEGGTAVSAAVAGGPVGRRELVGLAHDPSHVRLTVTGLPSRPGITARLFRVLAEAGAEIDVAAHAALPSPNGQCGDLTLVLPEADATAALAALRAHRAEVGYQDLEYGDAVGTVSLVGCGMDAAVLAVFCETLARTGVDFRTLSATPTRIRALCGSGDLPRALRALHRAYALGADSQAPLPAHQVPIPCGKAAP